MRAIVRVDVMACLRSSVFRKALKTLRKIPLAFIVQSAKIRAP